MEIPLPDFAEQAAIAAYLDLETAKLDALVGKVEEAVERLQEYRTALITAAVNQALHKAQAKAPSRSLVSIDDVGVTVAFLGMNGAKLITGETLYIDGGYHIMD